MQQIQGLRQGKSFPNAIVILRQHKLLNILCLSLLLFFLGYSPAWSADDYLSELDAEVKKVETRKIDGESGENIVEEPAELPLQTQGGRSSVSRDDFEALLKHKYLGTFGFYKKLPERSREEIFLDYSAGAPMTVVRKKIIDRLLQR